MSYPLLSGRTPVIYHSIPSDKSLLLTTPKQEAILAYLSQIPHNMFPEFVKDILIMIEGHTLIDITDGPGDEKLDILTVTPDGKKCLTQCKHTKSSHTKYNGDDLDLLISACIRKGCGKALFVTNGDLTTQAKRYVVDDEYCKGWPSGGLVIINYWNYYEIWKKIQSNTDILNKWFGGLGQLHGLRNFKFDLSICKLPCDSIGENEDTIGNLISILVARSIIEETEENGSYKVNIDKNFEIHLKRWIQFQNSLDINFLSHGEDPNYNNQPMDCLSLEVIITNNITYTPNLIRKKVIRYLLDDRLHTLSDVNWWHIVSGRSTSFVFIHDINEPRQITLDSAETFVKIKGYKLSSELDYCSLAGREFVNHDEENDGGFYKHSESGCNIIQYFKQRIEPFDELNHKGIQNCQWAELKDYNFRVVTDINWRIMFHLTNMLPLDWYSFQINENTLTWCYPNNANSEEIKAVEKGIQLLGFQLMQFKFEDLQRVLADIDMSSPDFILHDDLKQLRFPIDLRGRVFMISKEFPLNRKVDIDWFINLATYKIRYEKEFGNYSVTEEEVLSCRNFELPYILSDVRNMRGNRMLDINVWNNPIWVTMRFREERISPSKELVLELVEEFQRIFCEIESKFS